MRHCWREHNAGDVISATNVAVLTPAVDSDTCYYAVAIAKNGTGFGFTELKGLNSCHTGLGNSAGWNIPIGTLMEMGQIQWDASENRTIEQGNVL